MGPAVGLYAAKTICRFERFILILTTQKERLGVEVECVVRKLML